MRELPVARVAVALETQTSLDPIAERIGGVIRRAPRALLDVLHGKPLGHPAHPLLILLPAGAWISAAVLDLLPGHARASRTLVGAGLLGAAPTAAAGWADWSGLRPRQQRVGLVHAAANVVAVGLYSASWVQRRRGRQASGVVLGMAGLTVISVSGYLGGHLSYRQAAAVNHAAEVAELLPAGWTTVGMLDEFHEAAPSRRLVGAVPVLFRRRGAEVDALADACTFCGSSLVDGSFTVDTVSCAHDGSEFRLDSGEAVSGPATSPQPRFACVVSEGFVAVTAA